MRRVEIPVLVIWGERDRYLGAELAEPDRNWVPNVRVARLPDASHWVQLDQPEEVNALLVEFLSNQCRDGSRQYPPGHRPKRNVQLRENRSSLTVDYTEEQVEEALNVVRGSIDDIEASRSEDEWPAQQWDTVRVRRPI